MHGQQNIKNRSSTACNTNCTLSDKREIISIYAARNKFARHTKSSGTVFNNLSTVPLRLHNNLSLPFTKTYDAVFMNITAILIRLAGHVARMGEERGCIGS